MKRTCEAGYNQRLFDGGFRRWLHLARFEWLRDALRRAGVPCHQVLELGCFDGRSIRYLPHPPDLYVGLDANWENGLETAQESYAGDPHFEFHKCTTPNELRQVVGGRRFDTTICLETLEHVPPELVEDYVRSLAEVSTGVMAVTVPNEKGLVFLSKYLTKRALGDFAPYRVREIVAATFGRMHAIERNDHKGFDYDVVIAAIGTSFQIVDVSGYPLRSLPKSAGFGVGILAKTREAADHVPVDSADFARAPSREVFEVTRTGQ